MKAAATCGLCFLPILRRTVRPELGRPTQREWLMSAKKIDGKLIVTIVLVSALTSTVLARVASKAAG